MKFSARLKYCPPQFRSEDASQSTRRIATNAWFLPGTSVQQWLNEIARWNVDTSALRIRFVPGSSAENRCGGILVDSNDANDTAGSRPSIVQGGAKIAYRRITLDDRAGTLFLPRDADILPAVDDAELAALLQTDSLTEFVWTPTGLTGFEASEICGIEKLLSPPPRSATRWHSPRTAAWLNDRVVSIEPIVPLNIDDMLRQAADDIGSNPIRPNAQGQPSQLPPAPGESSTPSSGQIVGGALRPLARLVQRISAAMAARQAEQEAKRQQEKQQNQNEQSVNLSQGQASGSAGPAAWHARLGNWANSILDGTHQLFQNARERELNRLMAMLKTDPDRGLRFAIPFGGGDAPRGISQPGARLVEQNVNFRLGSGGGGAADYWSMSAEMRHQLFERYRELAEREQSLGRYRRAAYIYGQLLNDYHSAARVLAAGGHYHEAAALFRDKLQLPRDAARCLESGGLWLEAAEAWEDLKAWELAAALFDKLEEPDRAKKNWLRAADDAQQSGQIIKAAGLHETKLHDFDTALQTLDRGWISGHPPGKCLREFFDLLARHNRHDLATEKVTELRDRPGIVYREEIKAAILSHQAREYPDRHVQELAANATRRIAARQLSQTAAPRMFLNSLRDLESGDRLLERDCRRFEKGPPKETVKAKTIPRGNFGAPEFQHTLQLDSNTDWQQVVFSEGLYFALGYRPRPNGYELRLGVFQFNGERSQKLEHITTQTFPIDSMRRILLAACPRKHPGPKVLAWSEHPGTNSAISGSPYVQLATATPADSLKLIHDFAVDSNGTEWQLTEDLAGRNFQVDAFHQDQRPGSSRLLDRPEEPIEQFCLKPYEDRLYVSLNARLFELNGNLPSGMETIEFGHHIHRIITPPYLIASRLIVTFAEGGALYWPKTGLQSGFGFDLHRPLACFTSRGLLVAVDERGRGEIYKTSPSPELISNFQVDQKQPIGLLPLPGGTKAGFVVMFPNGEASMYRFEM